MFEFLLSIFCAYRNGQLAKQKGQNTVVWGLITIVAFFITYSIGGAILIAILYKGPLQPEAITEFILARPVLSITIMFFGLGGYLLTRYILEKMNTTKKEGE
jgi:DMSO reductase anchor subunit